MASFEEIDEARRLLGLGEAVTLKDIKHAYSKLAFDYHPDTAGEDPEHQQMMKNLNRAYRVLTEYCSHYRYTFSEDDVHRVYPEERFNRRYGRGWFDGP